MAIETADTEGLAEMAVTLGEALLSAIAKGMIGLGEGSAGTLPDAVNGSKRGPDAETPGQVLRRNIVDETTQPGKAPASSAEGRGRATHHTAPPQRRVARPMLSVIEGGGGRRRQEGEASAAFRAATGRERVREFLKLVGG